MRQRLTGWGRLVSLVSLVVILVLAAVPGSALGQGQQLKLPFRAGEMRINWDETYTGDIPHPTSSAIAFDMVVLPDDPNVELLAIGSGDVRLACTHRSGASVLFFSADGYVEPFIYVHVEAATLPSWMSTSWTRVQQGEVLGRMFPGAIQGRAGDSCLQFSTGPHLHLDLPQLDIVLDGVNFNEDFPNDFDRLTSTNGLTSPESAICDGLDATIIGTAGSDILRGTDGPDVIAALQGDDQIFGLGGDDVICGGKGNDRIYGGGGFDVLFGAQGNDTIYGADGNQFADHQDTKGGRYFGGAGDDTIFGTNRWDRMQGGVGRDNLLGFAGRDWMRGGAHNDRLDGGGAIDDMNGGNGSDELIVGTGDVVRGGAGSQDRCDLSGGQPETLVSCEVRI